MSGRSSSRARLRDPRGVTWVSVLLILLTVGAAYLAWVWGPPYLDHYTLRQAARSTMNEAIKNRDEAVLLAELVRRVRTIRTVAGVDEATGKKIQVPAIPLSERQVTLTCDREAKPPVIRIQIEYEREIEYPLLNRTVTKTFLYDETGDLTPADWSR